MEYKSDILKLIDSINDETILTIIYNFLNGFLSLLQRELSCRDHLPAGKLSAYLQ